ncbi:MAG: hypothetical protein ACR2NR_16035 [Solirubrobacteraceae bacterium]
MSLPALAAALREHGGTVATLVVAVGDEPRDGDTLPDTSHPPQLAARGPRVVQRAGEYELLLEMIFEGSLLHYGTPRVLRVEDPDLALLLGDQLYALGLSRLAELGDLEAVAELADLISLLAQARAADDDRLAEAVWQAGAAAIGWGTTAEHEAAKALARAGDRGAVAALRRSARREAADRQ